MEEKKTGEETFHAKSPEEVLRQLDVEIALGLSAEEVRKRQERYGQNELQQEKAPNAFIILLNQFKSIVILILVVATVAALVTARWAEGLALVAVIFINTAIGFFTEFKAVRSMEALHR